MGIYSDGNVYGIRWTIYDKDCEEKASFEKVFSVKMTLLQIQEIKEQYDMLSEDERRGANYHFYTSISDTYGDSFEPYMGWWPANGKALEELFSKGDVRI